MTAGIDHVTLAAGPFILRPPSPSEAPEALAMLHDPAVAQWNPAPAVLDLDTAAQWCQGGADWSSGTHATWSVVDSQGHLLGNVSLWQIDRFDQRAASIGYRTAPWARNRGVATQAVRAASAWALSDLGLERIELPHAVPNPASCRVATKCAFVLEGTLRCRYRDPSGRRWDEHLHARLVTDPVDASA